MLEEQVMLPIISKAYCGLELQIPNLELVKFQKKLEE